MSRAQITYWNPAAQKEFGDNLFAYRKSLNLTQQEFAEKLIADNDLPYSRSYLSDLEIGLTPPSQRFLESVYFAFDKDWNELLPVGMPFEEMHRGRNPAVPYNRLYGNGGGRGSGVPHRHVHGSIVKNRKRGTVTSGKFRTRRDYKQLSTEQLQMLYNNIAAAKAQAGFEKNVAVVNSPRNRGYITPSVMSQINHPTMPPSKEILQDYANVFDTTVDDLLQGTDTTIDDYRPAPQRKSTLERVVQHDNGDSGTAQETGIGVEVMESGKTLPPGPERIVQRGGAPISKQAIEDMAKEQEQRIRNAEAEQNKPIGYERDYVPVDDPVGITLKLVDGELTIVYPNGLSIVTRSFDGTITL